MSPEDDNGWNVWQKLIVAQLEQNQKDHDKIFDKLNEVATDLATTRTELRIKAGMWGLIAGAIPGTIAILWTLIKHGN